MGDRAIPKLVAAIEANQTVMVKPPMIFSWGMDDQSRFEGRSMGMMTVSSIDRDITLADGSSRNVSLFTSERQALNGPASEWQATEVPAFRTWAGLTLARIGRPAIPAVEPLARSSNLSVINEATRVLKFIDPDYQPPPPSSDVLLQLATKGGSGAGDAITELKTRGELTEEVLRTLLSSPSQMARRHGIELLPEFDELSPESRQSIVKLIASGNDIEASEAAMLHARRFRLNAQEVLPTFLPLLENKAIRIGTGHAPVFDLLASMPADPPIPDSALRVILAAGLSNEQLEAHYMPIFMARQEQCIPLLIALIKEEVLPSPAPNEALVMLGSFGPDDPRVTAFAVELLQSDRLRDMGVSVLEVLSVLANSTALDDDAYDAVQHLRDANAGNAQFGVEAEITKLADQILSSRAGCP